MATVADELLVAELPEETRAMLKRLCADGTIYDVLDVALGDDMCPVCEHECGDFPFNFAFGESHMIDAYLRGHADAQRKKVVDMEDKAARTRARKALNKRGML